MKNQNGFSLIELLIVVVIIGIIVAIAVPNLLASRRAANESSAVSALRSLHGAQATYSTTFGSGNFAGTVAGLDGAGLTQLGTVGLIDNVLGSGTKSGYVFTTGTTSATPLLPASFCIRAIPVVNSGLSATGSRCFGIATDGVIMTNDAASGANCGCAINVTEFVAAASPLSN